VNHARVSQSGIAWMGDFPSGVNVNASVIVLTDGVVFAIESDVMPLHGVSFGGLLAFEIRTVDHHSEDSILEGEDHGFGESCGERASATVNSQSGGRSMDNHSVLVVEHENCHS
jgi:hypothetical protein